MTDETIDSTNDARSAVRSDYRHLTENEKIDVRVVKVSAADLIEAIDTVEGHEGGDPRELAIARRKAEEAVMWAVKAITKEKS